MATQNENIKKHLQKGGSLTALTALKKFGCLRLGGRIFELRKTMKIHSEMVKVNGKLIAKYYV